MLLVLKEKYFKKGLWKDKKAIILYTQGGPEILHRLKKRIGYHVLKYPLNLSGIYDISVHHIDNLNRNKSKYNKIDKKVNQITKKY
nr:MULTISPECIES: NAD(P)H-dependent oxidoreductase [Staphylococcus]